MDRSARQFGFAGVDGFTLAYRENAAVLLRFFFRQTMCAEVAADLTAETFAKAWRLRKRFDAGRGSVGAWLQVLARQELLQYLRHERVSKRARAKLGIGDFEASLDEVAEIERRCDADGVRDELAEALRSLSSLQADALRLRVIEQLPYCEVAGRLGCTTGAARVRVARAIAELNQTLSASGVIP